MLATNRLNYLALALFAFAILGLNAKRSTFIEETESDESNEFEVEDKFIANKNQRPLNQILSETPSKEAESLTGQELVDYVNRHQNLWRAELNDRFLRYNEDTKYGLMGVNHVENSIEGKKNLGKSRYLDIDLPETFDSREKWPQCKSLFVIRDQSSCGSCWAFGAVEAMSDRICIASGGSIQVSLSADDLLSCCHLCGFGCNGGDPLAAWKYWVRSGIVTGSNFTAGEGCKPYPFPPCEHHSNSTHYEPCPHKLYPTPKCDKKCQTSYNDKTYNEDKFYGKKAYSVERKVQSIQNELFTNGPMEIAFEVYEDFLNYKGGIYKHTGGKLGGGHAVKLIGWGEENGVPYWTVANSWNTDWGEGGFFRIIRGNNECGIESGVVAGIPDLNRRENDFEGSYHRQRRHFQHEHNLH